MPASVKPIPDASSPSVMPVSGNDKVDDRVDTTSSSSTMTEDVRQGLRLVDPCFVTAAFVRAREPRRPSTPTTP